MSGVGEKTDECRGPEKPALFGTLCDNAELDEAKADAELSGVTEAEYGEKPLLGVLLDSGVCITLREADMLDEDGTGDTEGDQLSGDSIRT